MTTALRDRVRKLVDSARFQSVIIALIVINTAILGVETYSGLPPALLAALRWVNAVIIGVFVVEIVLRIYAHRSRFFRDPWGWFDLFIVTVALIPAGAGGEVLRVLRALRVLRLLSTVRSMRLVVGALITSMPGIASIGALLVMVMYIYAVIATELFAPAEDYQDLGRSFASLFRVLVGDGWGDVVTPVATTPGAWILFISFSVVTAIIVLNLFIAVAVEAMDRFKEQSKSQPSSTPQPAARNGTRSQGGEDQVEDQRADSADRAELMKQIRQLREQLTRVESQLERRPF